MTTTSDRTAGTTTRAYPFPAADPLMPPEEIAWLRANEPIAKVTVPSGDEVWLVTRAADVRAVMSDLRFSRNFDRPGVAQLLPGVKQPSSPIADPPAHTRWRRLVSKAFTAREVENMRPKVQEIVDSLFDEIEAAPRPVDMMEALAFPLPIAVVCALLGMSVESHRRFRELAGVALAAENVTAQQRLEAFGEMQAYARDVVVARRADPGPDLLTKLIAVHDEDDDRLSEDELGGTVLTLLVGGYENTAHQIGKALYALFRYPDQWAVLRDRPEIVVQAVDEMLRFTGSIDSGFGSPRYATTDIAVGDTVIPEGATVLVLRSSANRDAAEFEDPDRFDLTRPSQQHYSFGVGPHYCLGAALAKLELQMAFGTLARRFPTLRLAIPIDEVRWAYRVTASGPAALPVTW